MRISSDRSSSSRGKVPAMVDIIVLVGALTRCALLHFAYNLKYAQMNVRRCLIQEIIMYTRSTKSILAWSAGAVEYTDCIFAEGKNSQHTSVLDMIFNSLYMYKEDLALNNLQWLICRKTQPTQILYI